MPFVATSNASRDSPATFATSGELARAARALVAERLGVFAAGWLLIMVGWTVALSLGSTHAAPPAMLIVTFQAAVLGLTLLVLRRGRARAYANAVALGALVTLSVSSVALFVAEGRAGELLVFVLFTLCLMAALLLPWGWRMELALLGGVLGPFALAIPRLTFAFQPFDLATAIAIGSLIAVAIAEGHARSLRAVLARGWSEGAAIRALAASRDAYRDLAEHARDFIWSADLAGRLTYINEAGAQILGETPAALIGRNVDHYATDHPANPDLPALRGLLAGGAPLPPTLVQWRTAHGLRWVEVVAYAVRGPGGEVIGFRGINRDVTERVAAEEALLESEARYRGVIESQQALIYRSDLDGKLTFINEACRRMYGVNDISDRPTFFDFIHPDDVAQARAALQTIAPGGRYRRTSRGRTPEGWRWIEWEVCAISNDAGLVTEIQGVGHDVTERRRADEALQGLLAALREREEQLRLMGLRQVEIREEERKRLGFDLHDGVCQELVGIAILIESARQRGVSEAADPTLMLAQRHLSQVGEHLRMLARDLRPLQLPDLGLAESVRTLAAGMATDTTCITTRFPTAIPRLGEETEVAVYRVAQEALANAVRHAGARTVVLTLGTVDGTLRLEIRDDGRGFDREGLRSRALGLVAMEERAVALGGSLRVHSTPGAGTTVCFECPLNAPEPESTG